jgi:SAM-dependent methyltransferase
MERASLASHRLRRVPVPRSEPAPLRARAGYWIRGAVRSGVGDSGQDPASATLGSFLKRGDADRPDYSQLKNRYDEQYRQGRYSVTGRAVGEGHPSYDVIADFIDRFSLTEAHCLEVGCGRGALSDIVKRYVGVDLSEVAGRALRKHFVVASATELPFADGAFDAAWTITTLEHVSEPEKALRELRRVVRDGGLLYVAPAWFCRTWAAEGCAVRPYRDLGWRGKIVKASIPLRDQVAFRLPAVLARRIIRLVRYRQHQVPTPFRFRPVRPSYDVVWTSDSDAVASMDPFEAILWFTSRGDECLSHPWLMKAFCVRTGALVVRINHHDDA